MTGSRKQSKKIVNNYKLVFCVIKRTVSLKQKNHLIEMVVKKNSLFSTSTQILLISLCVRAHFLKYVKGTHQGHQIAFSDFKFFVFVRKNKDFAELKVPLIHRKQVPLLHNTVLILCDEGDGLVAVEKKKNCQ